MVIKEVCTWEEEELQKEFSLGKDSEFRSVFRCKAKLFINPAITEIHSFSHTGSQI